MEYWHSLGNLKAANVAGTLKTPKDFVVLLLKVLELINTWGNCESAASVTYPYLYVDTDVQRRAYIVKGNQIVSFAFPFSIYIKDDLAGTKHIFINYRDVVLDDVIVSKAMSIANNLDLDKSSYAAQVQGYDFSDNKKLFELILSLEPSYLRYDYDKPSKNGVKHPMYHLDINFNKYYTYKVGLYNAMQINRVKDLVSQYKDCWYIGPCSRLSKKEQVIKNKIRIKR